jgi:hypothetical protein
MSGVLIEVNEEKKLSLAVDITREISSHTQEVIDSLDANGSLSLISFIGDSPSLDSFKSCELLWN